MILAAILVVFFITPALAGKWMVGDTVHVNGFCKDLDTLNEIAEISVYSTEESNLLFTQYTRTGQCVSWSFPFPGMLKKLEATINSQAGPGEIWAASLFDVATIYVYINATNGPHEQKKT